MSELESERNWINNSIIIFNHKPIHLSTARSTVTEPQAAPRLTPPASPVPGSSRMPGPRPPAAEQLLKVQGDVCAQARSHPPEHTCTSHTPGTSAAALGHRGRDPRCHLCRLGWGHGWSWAGQAKPLLQAEKNHGAQGMNHFRMYSSAHLRPSSVLSRDAESKPS